MRDRSRDRVSDYRRDGNGSHSNGARYDDGDCRGRWDQQRGETWSKDSRGSRGRGGRCSNGGSGGHTRHGDGDYERGANQRHDRSRNHRQRDADARHGREKDHRDDIELSAPCIWIGGCPSDITEREIERLCAKYGPVHNVTIKHSSRDTFAFARYGQLSHAKDAIRGLDQRMAFGSGIIKVAPANRKASTARREDEAEGQQQRGWRQGTGEGRGDGWSGRHGRGPEGGHGRSASRQPSRPRRRQGPRPIRVYISQLPRDMEEDELQDIAAEYGKVLAYELHREGAYKAAWVEYASRAEAEAAVSELDDRRMDEWNMRLQAYMYPGGEP